MSQLKETLTGFLWGNFGHCRNCIRKAFLATAVAWASVLLIYVSGRSMLLSTFTAISVTITLLWVTHLLVFARKRSLGVIRRKSNNEVLTRRNAMGLFVRVLMGAALASALPGLALADGTGPCAGENCGKCFRPEYNDEGGWECIPCHSCPGPDNKYDCN